MNTLKIIQLNAWKGKLLEGAIEFLRRENPDIITLQEATAGRENFRDDDINVYEAIKDALSMRGFFSRTHSLIGDPNSFLGNAVLTRGRILKSSTIWLKEYADVVPEEQRDHPNSPRNAIDCLIEIRGMKFHALSAHLAWTKDPVDTPEKIRQAQILADHLRLLATEPYILGGDFNMPSGSGVVNMIETVGKNIVTDPRWGITRSTHPTIHKTASFKPEGLLVDFIFTSSHFTPRSVDAPYVNASDHLPIRAMLGYHP